MPRKIRILHVFPSLEHGGSQSRFCDILRDRRTHQQHLALALNGDQSSMQGLEPDMMPEIITANRDMISGSFWSRRRAIRQQLKAIAPDLLVTYNWGAIEWALANRMFPICPVLQVQDGFNPEEQSTEIPRRRWLRRLAYGGRCKLAVPSFTLLDIARTSWRVGARRLMLIPNGVDLSHARTSADAALLHNLGIDESDFLVLTAAALRPEKNTGRLIEAMRYLVDHVPTAKLLILGDGIGMKALTMLRDRIDLRKHVIFAGHIDAPASLISRADICALSSDTEQMPLFVLEAMAAGKPIVSTDVGDIARMVAPSNQPFIAGRDAAILCENMRSLAHAPDQAKAIGQDNQDKAASDFDKGLMLDRWAEAFDQAAG